MKKHKKDFEQDRNAKMCLVFFFVELEFLSLAIIPWIPFHWYPDERKIILLALFTILWILLCFFETGTQQRIAAKCRNKKLLGEL